ncbi:EamA family transporter [Thermoactinomyces sp. AMNI-1]|uniref:EamA family transporter n=2 Tax=Thermoactinomyces mirandus TaxID=2756294 RepID=A0A7W1XR70_9BACL|nr:EamA family transporter [Thermoactinomyces mirandus]
MSLWFILALLSSLTFGLAGFLMKVSSVKKGDHDFLLWGLYLTGSLGFLWWMVKTRDMDFSCTVLIAGVIVGIGSAFGNLLFMKALDIGPASLTSPVVNGNIVLMIGMSMLIYGETITVSETAGVALLVIAMMILPVDPNESLKIRNKRWYALVFITMLLFFFRNGGLKITEEMHLSGTSILFVSYVFGFFWFTFQIFHRKLQIPSLVSSVRFRTGVFWGLAAGIFSFAGMQLYAVALNQGPATLIAPIFSTNSLVVALLSILIYREQLSLFQTLSLILLFSGLILIRI